MPARTKTGKRCTSFPPDSKEAVRAEQLPCGLTYNLFCRGNRASPRERPVALEKSSLFAMRKEKISSRSHRMLCSAKLPKRNRSLAELKRNRAGICFISFDATASNFTIAEGDHFTSEGYFITARLASGTAGGWYPPLRMREKEGSVHTAGGWYPPLQNVGERGRVHTAGSALRSFSQFVGLP